MLNRMSENRAGIRDRRGVALMTVIVATVVVGAMAAGAVFVGIQEQRMGEGVRRLGKSAGVSAGGRGRGGMGARTITSGFIRSTRCRSPTRRRQTAPACIARPPIA